MAYGCPECGDTRRQVQQDVVPASAHVQEWDENDDGEPVPVWAGDTTVHWNGQHQAEDLPRYACRACGAEYEEPEEVEA